MKLDLERCTVRSWREDAAASLTKYSVRILEKAGYRREARLRRSAIKDGRIIDQFLYAYVP